MRIGRGRRNHDVLAAAEPQNDGRDEHEHARNTEVGGGPELPQKDRHEKRSEERAEIDNPVESIEHHFGAMLVCLVKLVTDEGGDTRLDPAGSERDQSKSDIKADPVVNEHGQASLTCAINQAE